MSEAAVLSGHVRDPDREFSEAVIALMKGPIYRDTHERPWQHLLAHRGRIDDYVALIGLDAYVDESEGYAFLRTRPELDEDEGLPRLVHRRRLSFPLSLLLVLLRRRLAEHDAAGGDTKAVITREQIVALLRTFLPEGRNDARLFDQIDTHIKKSVDLGFLRQVKGDEATYEVRRILVAFVDAQWLADFDARLDEYADQFRENQPVESV
ncbi:MAG TPA: DUF4194 domain-containing protein [Aeromicrobium sp.]|nr:DUF4194 domain-containing protein [Aeromicrobium sp.]